MSGPLLLPGSYQASDLFLALLELFSDVSHLFVGCLKLLGEVRVVASHFLRRFEMLG